MMPRSPPNLLNIYINLLDIIYNIDIGDDVEQSAGNKIFGEYFE